MKTYIIGCIFCLSFLFISCSDDDDNTGNANVESIKILETVNDTIFIQKGDEYQVKFETAPANSQIKFYSNKPESFRVNQNTGLITTTAGGVGSLIAIAPNGEGWTKTVTVIYVIEYIEKITLKADKDLRFIASGTSALLSNDFEIESSTATNKKLIYTSSDPSIVSVDKDGLATSLSKGIVKITAKAADGGPAVSEPITVYSGYADTKLSKSGWEATAISTQSGNYQTYRIIDDNTTTFWHSSWDRPLPFPYYVLIDMKAMRSFYKIVLTRRASYADNRDMEYYISDVAMDGLSADDPSFTKLTEYSFGDEPASVRTHTYNIFPDAVQSRYLKIVMLNSNRALGDMSIAEVDVYAVVED